jgi:hypothetical protein
MALPFDLTRQYEKGIEKVIAKFAEEKDIREFMQSKTAWDHKTRVSSIYRLYANNQVICEINTAEQESVRTAEQTSQRKSFGPTPLATTPSPFGSTLPPSSRNEDQDDV